MQKLFTVEYGSKLYGTSTEKSDTDLKTVFLPKLDDMLLGKKLQTTKDKFDADGNEVGVNMPMPDNGVEEEFFPLQTFVHDFVSGQTYAVEVAYAYFKAIEKNEKLDDYVWNFMTELLEKFATVEINSMVGFAMKQTFDYVHRGDRLKSVREVLSALKEVSKLVVEVDKNKLPRLDTVLQNSTRTAFDFVAQKTGVLVGVVENSGKTMRSLELNGRSYLETTSLQNLITTLEKLENSYGERSNKASEVDVDFKSLSHAVRVYEQCLEMLDGKPLIFPRPNAAFLLSIKEGKENPEVIKALLLSLDAQVKERVKTSTGRRKTPELMQELNKWLVNKLRYFYL